MSICNRIAAILFLACSASPATLLADHDSSADGKHTTVSPHTSEIKETHAERYFTNIFLVDQHGQQRRLYRDLMHNKVLVINGFFTGCKASCPLMMGKMAMLQDALGDRLERDVRILSVTVDPTGDPPGKVADYAKRFAANRGWYLLSGKREDVDLANHKFGQFSADPDSHRNVIIVGNERTGWWKKLHGAAALDEIHRVVNEVLAD